MLDASHPAALPISDTLANAVLLIFTLSAVHPANMAEVLRLAYRSLRLGGLLLFRDYAEVSATSISSLLRLQSGLASLTIGHLRLLLCRSRCNAEPYVKTAWSSRDSAAWKHCL